MHTPNVNNVFLFTLFRLPSFNCIIAFVNQKKTSCNIPRIQSLVTPPQIDSAVPVHAGRSGGDDEVVRAQRGVRAAGHGPRDVPAVLVAQPAVYQHALPGRTDGRIPT